MENYTIRKKIGKGSFSEVYSAKDQLGNKVAIKYIEKAKVSEWHVSKFGKKIPLEVYILHKMRGTAGIPWFVEYFSNEEFFAIVMEQPNGAVSLQRLLDESGPLPEATVKKIFSQLVVTLQKLWTAGFVHGDLKPDNLLVNPVTLSTYLVDFGLSSARTEEPMDKMRGTLSYAAPEMFAGNFCFSEEVEIWALGVLLYNTVNKTALFESQAEVMLKKIEPPSQHVSRKMRRLLLQMLDRKPLTRINLEQVQCSGWLSS